MKLSDKPLEIVETLGEVIEKMRANGLEQDANELHKQMLQMASTTNWTRGELMALDFVDWPKLARRFAGLMAGKGEAEIPPQSATVSDSMQQAQDDLSRSGQTC